MTEYISRKDAEVIIRKYFADNNITDGDWHSDGLIREIRDMPAADVVARDEGIRIGAELAAMHGSDATTKELEEAFFEGVEFGRQKAKEDQKTGKWVPRILPGNFRAKGCSICRGIWGDISSWKYCPNCGAKMEDD